MCASQTLFLRLLPNNGWPWKHSDDFSVLLSSVDSQRFNPSKNSVFCPLLKTWPSDPFLPFLFPSQCLPLPFWGGCLQNNIKVDQWNSQRLSLAPVRLSGLQCVKLITPPISNRTAIWCQKGRLVKLWMGWSRSMSSNFGALNVFFLCSDHLMQNYLEFGACLWAGFHHPYICPLKSSSSFSQQGSARAAINSEWGRFFIHMICLRSPLFHSVSCHFWAPCWISLHSLNLSL